MDPRSIRALLARLIGGAALVALVALGPAPVAFALPAADCREDEERQMSICEPSDDGGDSDASDSDEADSACERYVTAICNDLNPFGETTRELEDDTGVQGCESVADAVCDPKNANPCHGESDEECRRILDAQNAAIN